MKTSLRFLSVLVIGLAIATGVSAADHEHGAVTIERVPAQPSPELAAWLAKAKASYPSATCVVSDDKLEGGDMGGPIDYICKEPGKPDRLVRFCCKDCIDDFRKDPAKYLAMLDEAEAKRAAAHAAHSHN